MIYPVLHHIPVSYVRVIQNFKFCCKLRFKNLFIFDFRIRGFLNDDNYSNLQFFLSILRAFSADEKATIMLALY